VGVGRPVVIVAMVAKVPFDYGKVQRHTKRGRGPIEVILRYIRNVSSLKKIELENHKNRTKNKNIVKFFEHFIVLYGMKWYFKNNISDLGHNQKN